ncbi:hypothetical protein, partial [Salmonella enterica]|uniref:hypothetical protein n=1 Tax=Salmonella enterica TaxID=28901 RepID=UPI0039E9F109
ASVAQSYGLAFASNEVVQDRRTGVDLSPGGSFEFSKDFELAFDISIQPFRVEYFGYILRVVGNNKNNIDLIYDNTPTHFKVVMG